MSLFDINESIEVLASPEEIFPLIKDFRNWEKWEPWRRYEPGVSITFGEKSEGVGGEYAWDGKIIGAGRMKHLDIEENRFIRSEIEFLRPTKSIAEVYWLLEQKTSKVTTVTWGMKIKIPFFLSFLANKIENTIIGDYRFGLELLASQFKGKEDRFSVTSSGVVTLEETPFWGMVFTKRKKEEIAEAIDNGFAKIDQHIKALEATPSGSPFVLYTHLATKGDSFSFVTGIPVKERHETSNGDLIPSLRNGGKFLKIVLQGDYRYLPYGWNFAMNTLKMEKLKYRRGGAALEVYPNSPEKTPREEWITELYLPVR